MIQYLRTYRDYLRQRKAFREACRALAADVERRCNSFKIQDYRKRREAAKLGWQRRVA